MIFLAVDTSLQATSVAIMEIGATSEKHILAEQYLNVPLTHSETTQSLVESCLASANLALKDVDCFVAITGPGSFTGLRIGVTLVKTLAATQNKPCVAVNSLAALAYKVTRLFRNEANTIVVPLIDARNERVFAQVFVRSESLIPTQALAFSDLLDLLQRQFKPEKSQVIFVTSTDLPFFAKYAAQLAEFQTFQLFKTELTAAKAVDHVADEYIDHTCEFLAYNDLQPNYYAVSQAERNKVLLVTEHSK